MTEERSKNYPLGIYTIENSLPEDDFFIIYTSPFEM